MKLTNILLKALRFAAEKHRNQRRKGPEQIPYVNHLIEVVCLLWENGAVRDESILAAAFLHDVLEDTDTEAEELLEAFGRTVTQYVEEVTDDKQLPKQERKRQQILHAPFKSPGAKQIKLADKCANIYDIVHYPPEGWSVERRIAYLAWADQVVQGLKGANAPLEALFYKRLKEGMDILDPV